MRHKTSLKQLAVLGLIGAALASGACSDEEDAVFDGEAGSGGTAGSSGSSSAGKSAGGKSSAGDDAGGNSNGDSGSDTGGHAGNGTAGTAPHGGSEAAGGAGLGGDDGGAGAPGGGAGGELGWSGAGGEGGGASILYAVLQNPGFEEGVPHVTIPGWTNEGTVGAAYIEFASPHAGAGKLSHWLAWTPTTPDFTARTYQTLDPIENGTYSFSMWIDRDDAKEQFLFATGFDAADLDAELTQPTDAAFAAEGYIKITLSGIVVTSGKITVGIHTENWAGSWTNIDDAEFVKTE